MTDSFSIDNNIIAFKQGNKINEWWLCAKVDVEYIVRLINTIIKTPDKKHKIQFINQKEELSYIEGNLTNKNPDNFIKNASLNDFNIIFYNASSINIVRKILIINLPQHNGLSADLIYSDSENDKKKQSSQVQLLPQFSKSQSSKASRDKKTPRDKNSRDKKKTPKKTSRSKFEPRQRNKTSRRRD
jgi:hypothetical protein